MSIDSIVLNNGIMLITEPIAMAKTVAIGFYFSVGSRYEQKNNRGITHFMEHMLFKGTKTRSYSDISKTFDRMGGYFNAFTEKETVCVHATIPLLNSKSNDSLKRAMEVLCDMTQNSIFPEAEYEKEAEVVKSEILSAEDDFEDCAFDSVEKLLWKNQILGENVSGCIDDIDSITREQMYSWYEEYIAHGELLVCVAGNIDVGLIKNMLEQLPVHKPFNANQKHFDQVAVWSKGFNFVKSDFRQEQIFILYPFHCPLTEIDYYSLLVLNAIMGDTMSSRFFQSIREKLGLCYNIYSYITLYEDVGEWGIYVSCDKENVATVLKELNRELSLLKENPPDENELEAAQEHLCGEEIIGDADMESHIKRLNRNAVFSLKQTNIDEILKAIRSVSLEQLKSLIDKLIIDTNRTIVVYGPKLSRRLCDFNKLHL